MRLGEQLHISPELVLIAEPFRVKNRWIKPDGGLWTSSYVGGQSDWVRWCESEQFIETQLFNWHVLTPDPSARIFHVDCVSDLESLFDIGLPLGRDVTGRYPDFEAVAKHYDAVHLTEAGQWATRSSEPNNLYGWDCESTLWFRWKFTGVRLVNPQPKTEEAAA